MKEIESFERLPKNVYTKCGLKLGKDGNKITHLRMSSRGMARCGNTASYSIHFENGTQLLVCGIHRKLIRSDDSYLDDVRFANEIEVE